MLICLSTEAATTHKQQLTLVIKATWQYYTKYLCLSPGIEIKETVYGHTNEKGVIISKLFMTI
jgi:hypothetical protein